MKARVERHENYDQGIPHIEWRAWNEDHTSYTSFHSRARARTFIKGEQKTNINHDAWIRALRNRPADDR